MSYTTIGLLDEVAELGHKINGLTYDNNTLTPFIQDDILGELGDVYWYIGQLAYELDINNLEINTMVDHFNVHHTIGVQKAWEQQKGLYTVGGAVAGLVKKGIRGDDGDTWSDERISKISMKLQDMLDSLTHIVYYIGLYDPTLVMERNIEKLRDRKERDQIRGDGDNR